MASASRNAVNGVSSVATFSCSASCSRRRTCPVTHARTTPATATAAVRQQQQPGDVQRPEMVLAGGDADGEAVKDQGGAVVDQTLGAQHGNRPARQGTSQGGERGGIGRRPALLRAPTPGPTATPTRARPQRPQLRWRRRARC